jgi:hypothetical protein
MRGPAGLRRLDPRAVRARRQVLALVARRLIALGRWPGDDEIRARLAMVDISGRVLDRLPGRWGRVDEDRRVVLTVEALRREPAARDLVDDFMRAVRHLAARFTETVGAEVSTSELRDELGLPPRALAPVLALLESEGLVDVDPDHGAIRASAAVLDCGAADSRGYVRRRRAAGPPRATGPARVAAWFANTRHSTGDLIAIALTAAVLSNGVGAVAPKLLSELAAGEGRHPPTASPAREERRRRNQGVPRAEFEPAAAGLSRGGAHRRTWMRVFPGTRSVELSAATASSSGTTLPMWGRSRPSRTRRAISVS